MAECADGCGGAVGTSLSHTVCCGLGNMMLNIPTGCMESVVDGHTHSL